MEIGDSGGGIGRLALAAANCGTDDMFVFHQDDSGVLWYRFFDNAKFENENGTMWPWGNDTIVGGQLDPMLSTPMTAVCWNDSDKRVRFFLSIFRTKVFEAATYRHTSCLTASN